MALLYMWHPVNQVRASASNPYTGGYYYFSCLQVGKLNPRMPIGFCNKVVICMIYLSGSLVVKVGLQWIEEV